MANRVVKESYGNSQEILKINEFVSIPVMFTDVGVTAVDGKKIVKAGTIVGGKTKAVLENRQEVVEDKNTALKGEAAEGVTLYDVDVTDGPREGSMIIFGFIDLNKVTAPVAEVALDMIKFLK